MTKHDLIKQIAAEVELPQAMVGKVLDAFTDLTAAALANGDSITLVGFGKFAPTVRKARTGRNPQTGQEIHIPERRVPTFTAGKQLKEAVSR